ncbi:TPA: hypothetical protein ACHJKB_001269 [Klebsiella variicola]
MTDITELAQILKAAAEKWQEAWGKYDKVEITIAEFIRAANQYESIVKDPANILALVEALEKAQQRIGKLEKKLTDHKRMNQEMAKAMLTPNDSDAAGMEIAALRQRIAELESRAVKLPLPSCTYADHSYPAYSKRQVISLLESLGITVVEGGCMTKSTITRERLEQLADNNTICKVSWDERIELAQIALAAMDSEAKEPISFDEWSRKCALQITLCYPDFREKAQYIWDSARETQQPAPKYPEVLPCSVLLEPGLRFGKGIKTSTMLAALARRAVYESDMAALSPEERAEFQAGIEGFKALIAQPAPVVPDGYVMVPVDLLSELRDWAHPEIEKYCEMWKGRRDSEFPALRKVIADVDALLAAAQQDGK